MPPVPSTVTKATTKATTTNTTTKDDEKKNSQNSNSNANEKKKTNFATTMNDDEDLKLPFDLTPHDAFKTDFQIGQKQLGITPIVHAKKFSKAIAIKAPSVGVKEKKKANTEKEDVEETTMKSSSTHFPPPPPLLSSGGGSNNNSIKIGSVFQKGGNGGNVPTKTSESLEAKRVSEATKTKDNNNNASSSASVKVVAPEESPTPVKQPPPRPLPREKDLKAEEANDDGKTNNRESKGLFGMVGSVIGSTATYLFTSPQGKKSNKGSQEELLSDAAADNTAIKKTEEKSEKIVTVLF